MEDKSLRCPCMPQCPNYGKCRQCIAAHAEYYTVPHCIKKMQEDLKRNHLHPSNPHIKKTLPERIEDYYASHPSVHLRTVAEELKITEWQLLDAMSSAVPVPVEDFTDIYEQLCLLDKVKLHLDTGAVVLQLTMKLPRVVEKNGVNIISQIIPGIAATSLIFSKKIYAVFLVREQLFGSKESLSVALVGEDEKIALSIYLCRSDENTVDEQSKQSYEALWNKYKKQIGESK